MFLKGKLMHHQAEDFRKLSPSRKLSRRSLTPLLLAVMLAGGLQAEERVKTRLQGIEIGAQKHGYGNSQWLYPKAETQQRIPCPDLKSNSPIYYAAKLGDSSDATFQIILDESEGPNSGYDKLYVDLNNDNQFDSETESFDIRIGDGSDDFPVRLRFEIQVQGKRVAYYANIEVFRYRYTKDNGIPLHATLQNSSYYVANLEFGNQRHDVAFLDLDTNGLFDDFERGQTFEGDRLMIDFNDDGKFSIRDDEKNESFPHSELQQFYGRWFSIRPSPDGSSVMCKEVQPALCQIDLPSRVSRFELYRPGQSLQVALNGGKGETLAGEYELTKLEIHSRVAQDGPFLRQAEKLNVSLNESEPFRLKFGTGLTAVPEVIYPKGGARPKIRMRVQDRLGIRYKAMIEDWESYGFGIAVVNSQEQLLFTQDVDSISGADVSFPRNLDGEYQLRPIVNLPGFEIEHHSTNVTFVAGKIREVAE